MPETLSLPVLRGADTAGGESAGRELTARSLGVDGTAAVVGVDTGRLAPAPSSAACGCATGIDSPATDAGNVTATGSTTRGAETGSTSLTVTSSEMGLEI